ncbi:Exopolyphosphatase [Candida viswanathii]|uniref:Exopolyphosphatase n=1 Tax=Candida viswanathii TaxID=5486 RepID=A0A367YLB6_9ASCO|nr:Exopolyphosphatase [Candida viswanathii]
MSIRSYLVNLKQKVDTKALKKPYTFVTGNQSADMDSVVSALTFAYFTNLHSSEEYVIPLINIPKDDLRLRRDIVKLLSYHSITEDLLYFVEDFERFAQESDKVFVNLVDHNNIQGDELHQAYKDGKADVVGIVDHHADEGEFLLADPRIIRTCGSNSSLVFNYFYSTFFCNDAQFFEKQHEVLELLLGPLLIDTSCMTQKVEEPDTVAFENYKKSLGGQFQELFVSEDGKTEIESFYSTLKEAKKDFEGFSFMDILRKDYKQFTFSEGDRVGFSSLGKSFKWIFTNYTKEEVQKTLSDALALNKLDLLVMSDSFTRKDTGKYTREFSYYYEENGKERYESLYKYAQEPLGLNDDVYGLNKITPTIQAANAKGTYKLFDQGNTTASRKQIVPIVKDILETKLTKDTHL